MTVLGPVAGPCRQGAGEGGKASPAAGGTLGPWGGGALAIPPPQVLPVTGAFMRGLDTLKEDAAPRLASLCDLWIDEMAGAVARHYRVPWRRPGPAAPCPLLAKFKRVCDAVPIQDYLDFLRMAAFAALGPNPACELHGRAPRAAFERWCFFVRFPEEADDEAAAAAAEAAAPGEGGDDEAAAAPAPPARERVPGRRAILAQLGPAPAPPPPDSDPGVQNPRQRVAAQVRAFALAAGQGNCPGAASGRHLCEWWHSRGRDTYPDLLPGVRVLLSDPAGNPPLERVFGQARSLLTPGRKLSDLREVLLRSNGPALQLPGYTHLSAPATES